LIEKKRGESVEEEKIYEFLRREALRKCGGIREVVFLAVRRRVLG